MKFLPIALILALFGCGMYYRMVEPDFYKDSRGVLWIQCDGLRNIYVRALLYDVGCRTMGARPNRRAVAMLRKRFGD